MMRIILLPFVVLALATASYGGSPFAVSGSSSKFVVDTREDVFVGNVSCAYCSGEYGGNGGTRATFLTDVYLWVEFKINGGEKPPRVDHYLVNGKKVLLAEFSMNIGDLSPGDAIEVVAVGKNDKKSKPFRVNFDIAAMPPKWVVLPSGHALVGAEERPNERRVVYTASKRSSVTIFEGISDAFAIGGHDLPIQVFPAIEMEETLDSSTGVFCHGIDVGVRSYSDTRVRTIGRQRLANFAGASLWAEMAGGIYIHWNPVEMRWTLDWREGELGVKVGASGTPLYVRFPQTFNIVYAKIDISAEGRFAFRYLNESWSGSIDLDPLFALRGTLGAGLDGVACVEGFAQGGLLINAIVPGNPLHIQRVGGEFNVGVRAVFIGWEREWNFVERWWGYDATKSSVASLKLNQTSSSDGLGFRPIARDYGDGSASPAHRSPVRLALGAAASAGDTQILMHDGYPTPQPAIAAVGTGAALVYVRDNAARSDLDRTEIVFREEAADGSWGGETPIWDDGTADFQPKLALLPGGTAVAAWANAKSTFADGTSFESVCLALENAVGVRDPQSGVWTCANLTDDDALDWLPVLKGATNGTAVVAWVRNGSGDCIGSAEHPSDLAVSFCRNGSWTSESIAAGGIGAILSHDIAWDGERAVLVWAADADGDLGTDDSEIWAKSFENEAWSTPVRLSAQSATAMRPSAWYLTNGIPHVVWVQGDALFASEGLTAASGTNVATAAELSIPGDYRISVREDGSATLLWTTDPLASESGLEGCIMSADYAPGSGLSASAVFMKQESAALRNLSGVMDADDTFRIAYESVAVSTNAEGQLVRGAVDLAVAHRDAVKDVGIAADDCSFESSVAIGVTNRIFVGIQNYGTAASGTFEYRVWVGENEGKMLLGSGELSISPLSREVVEVPWTPAEGLANVAFTIEVDVNDAIGDSRRENNTLVWRPDVGSPSLSFRNAKAVVATDTLRLISTRIHNDSVAPVPAGMTVKFWRGEIGGELIGTDSAGIISGGDAGEYESGIAWDISNVVFTSEWERVVIELPEEQGGRNVAVWMPTPLYDPENDSGDDPGGSGSGGSGSGETPSAPPNIGGITGFGIVDSDQCFNFYFYGEVGFTYLVQYKERLDDAEWTTIESISPSSTGECPVAVPIDTSSPSGFFRIKFLE